MRWLSRFHHLKAYIKPTWSLHGAYMLLGVYRVEAILEQRICKFNASYQKRNSLENFVVPSCNSNCFVSYLAENSLENFRLVYRYTFCEQAKWLKG